VGAGGGAKASGLTLIELMVSLALGMTIIAMAWSAFMRTKTSTARATALVDLHASAAVVREYLNRDLANMAPTVAFFARSLPQVPGTDANGNAIQTDTVEMVFMRFVERLSDEASSDPNLNYKSDFVWVRWRFQRIWTPHGASWSPNAWALYRSVSTPARNWLTLSAWTTPSPLTDPIYGQSSWVNYGGRSWLNIPRPLRDSSQGIGSLDNNRYGINPAFVDTGNSPVGDIGDLQDLDRPQNNRIISARVRDLAIGWHDGHGTDVQITSLAAADQRIDGLYTDVTGPAHNDYLGELSHRPRVVRVAFNLYDSPTGVSQDFSFSVAMPGFPAQIGQ